MHVRLYVKLKGGVMFEEEISSILLQRVVLCGLRLGWLKVSYSQNDFLVSSNLPKSEPFL